MTSSASRIQYSIFSGIILTVLWLEPCYAVINAGLQPYDLYSSRYDQVLVLQVKNADAAQAAVDCTIQEVLKGKLQAGKAVRLEFVDAMKDIARQTIEKGGLKPQSPIVVFAGRRRSPKDIMIYADTFYLGQMTNESSWSLDETSQPTVGTDGQPINTLAGTWNGSTEQLVEMVRDISADRDFFPRLAYASFQKDILLDSLDARIEGVAIYDIEGDGDEDILVCSDKGDRIYLQVDPMKFVDATAKLQLDSASSSCSVADVNADGLPDILAGHVVYLAKFQDNRLFYEKQGILPQDLKSNLKCAAFAELNADGLPDVIATVAGGGLRAFINQSGTDKAAFVETTEAMGLNRPECGAKQDGYISVGDWNGDFRMDIFYAAQKGFFLVQNSKGVFEPLSHNIMFKFSVGGDEQDGRTGAGVFLPLLNPSRMELIVPLEDGWIVVTNRNGKPLDITEWGNEISEGSNNHLASIADDFNLDGHVDFYTVCDTPNGHNRYIINRGYGSFMLADSHKHYERLFDGPASQLGGTAVASGDINEDGAPDLVIGNGQGHIAIILNDILEARKPIEHPTREIAVLQNTRALAVRVLGSRGTVNARIKVTDASGNLVARRDLGQNVASGCGGPNKVSFALRKPDAYKVTVEYTDGLIRSAEVDLKTQAFVLLNIDRGQENKNDVW